MFRCESARGRRKARAGVALRRNPVRAGHARLSVICDADLPRGMSAASKAGINPSDMVQQNARALASRSELGVHARGARPG